MRPAFSSFTCFIAGPSAALEGKAAQVQASSPSAIFNNREKLRTSVVYP
jgi:hypothetical protein